LFGKLLQFDNLFKYLTCGQINNVGVYYRKTEENLNLEYSFPTTWRVKLGVTEINTKTLRADGNPG
jgi:hypothetical protein